MADQPRELWLDLGAFETLEIMVRVLKTGTGNLFILHSAVDSEPESWHNTGVAIDLTELGTQFFTVSHFTRYIRWKSDLGGSPIVIIDIVAKGG